LKTFNLIYFIILSQKTFDLPKKFLKSMANWLRKIWAKPDLEDSNLDSSKGNMGQTEEDIILAGT
jgi:hypothetical protein